MKASILAFIILLGTSCIVLASHIRAGELTLRRLNLGQLQFELTLRIYYDVQSFVNNDSANIDIYSGSNPTPIQITIPQISRSPLTADVDVGVFRGNYTFPSPGEFTLVYIEQYRNADIRNMLNPAGTNFSVQTTFTIFPGTNNNTPILTVPPVDLAFTGQTWLHNPGAFDFDGDSLSFKLTIPKVGVGMNVFGYNFPNSPAIPGNTPPSTFTLDPFSGTLTWAAPRQQGLYNVAFIVEEWRRGFLMSSTMRDMQIIVQQGNNQPPVLTVPLDTCVVAGANLNRVILATDPNNDTLNLSAFGGPFLVTTTPASFSAINPSLPPSTGVFAWQTTCAHVRAQPYQVVFRAVDQRNGQGLTDVQDWNITVLGPPPVIQAVQPVNRAVQLTWAPYTCTNAIRMEIWRKEGPAGLATTICQQGMPAGNGYVRVGVVNLGGTNPNTYIDTFDLKRGTNYCYAVVAEFPLEARGRSRVSNEVCVQLDMDVPVILQSDVRSTGTANGAVQVAWSAPKGLDSTVFGPPYQYIIERATGASSQVFTPIRITANLLDTVWTDTGINTQNEIYRYRVRFSYGNNLIFRETTSPASTVRLQAVPNFSSIALNWTAQVPWNFESFYQYIYRDTGGVSTLIDSVRIMPGSILTYTDSGTFGGIPIVSGQEYCYVVDTRASYFNNRLPEPLINRSQRLCLKARDTIPPCNTTLSLEAYNCEILLQSVGLQVSLRWRSEIPPGCDPDVQGYNVYYSPTRNGTLMLLGFTQDTFFTYNSTLNVSGCYAVRVVDFSGNESSLSNLICLESCPYYELPNFITPNGDGLNDRFMPLPTPRFVEKVVFRVFNRWGRVVYSMDNDIMLNWPGVSQDGTRLPDGLYYYTAEIRFFSLSDTKLQREQKGWIQILSADGRGSDRP
jgi:gliding motility-associated-like protein